MKLSRLGTWQAAYTLAGWLTAASSAFAVGETLVAQGRQESPKQEPAPAEPAPVDLLDELRAMLTRPGPDGLADREAAVARLLELPRADAHLLLHDRLRDANDPDEARLTVLAGLQNHLLGSAAKQFGGADADLRRQLLTGYLSACAPLLPLWCRMDLPRPGRFTPCIT